MVKSSANGPDGLTFQAVPDAAAEFRIGRARYCVVPEDCLHGVLARQACSPDGLAPTTHVVGSCLVGGQRHLIVSDDGLEGDVPETEHSAVEVLTRRELQVALMVCEGLINKQIANRLGLSRWTIESYIQRACFKLGVKNRAALVARLISNIAPGISPDAPPD